MLESPRVAADQNIMSGCRFTNTAINDRKGALDDIHSSFKGRSIVLER